MAIAAIQPKQKGTYPLRRRARTNSMLTERNRSVRASSRNQFELIVEPTPKALIKAIQHRGHFGAAAMRMLVRAENPILLD